MVSVSTTLVLEAKFDTTDFVGSKDLGCDGFNKPRVSPRPSGRGGIAHPYHGGESSQDVSTRLSL
jgi:hypothetical protein